MKHSIQTITISAIVAGLVVALNLFAMPEHGMSKVTTGGNEVVFTVPIGPAGVNYADEAGKEKEPWGVASLRIAPDGSFLIVDPVQNQILRYTRDGTKTEILQFDNVVGITDVAANGRDTFVLDEAAVTPTILRVGRPSEPIPLPANIREKGLSGLALDETGELLLEIKGGASALKLNGQLALTRRGGKPLVINTPNLADPSVDPMKGSLIVAGGPPVTVSVQNMLGGLTVLGFGNEGDYYLLVEEVSSNPTIYVDQTVRHYSRNGKFLGIARVPLAERYTYVKHGVALAPDGNVYALVNRTDRVDVIRLNFSQSLESILPATLRRTPDTTEPLKAHHGVRTKEAPTQLLALAPVVCSRTRTQMTSAAQSYISNRTYLNLTNLNGYCPGRGKPHYLGTAAGYYNSVAYDWGGFDSVSGYNTYMSQNYQAGDINTVQTESCSRGVDCSGFVSRAWGLGSKYSTSSLPNISYIISASSMRPGDILNKPGIHVVMINSVDVYSGVWAWEATTNSNADRVVYAWSGWSRLLGYDPRRYTYVC